MKQKRKNKSRGSFILRIALLGFCVYLVYSMISLQAQLAENKKVLEEEQAKIVEKKITIKELKDLLKNGSKDELIEREARDKLDFVFKNEDVHEDISGK